MKINVKFINWSFWIKRTWQDKEWILKDCSQHLKVDDILAFSVEPMYKHPHGRFSCVFLWQLSVGNIPGNMETV